ncbi:hypothetical protein BRARA_B03880 [Brassica rapa]|uniref:1-phosphatidylinositol 4-kinase n=1 Tax=Brassica campestris TaxID=3711 RepID=A0A398AGI7_BRACM|nr:hypothetical protein BRARA_B03880 [Brassica rapa]
MTMGRFLSLVRGDSSESPREITSPSNLISESAGSNGWLIRFFDSAFFCEWIAVSYLYKHPHAGVRDYLCNRMYTLPLSGIESYLFQICYMMVHKPSPSLDKFVIDICAKSLKIALKVHWFLLAELEDSEDSEGIGRIQEKCQIAATIMGEWSPLMRVQSEVSTPGSKNQVLSRLLSSKQKLFSLKLSPPMQKSLSFSPSPGSSVQDDGSQLPAEDSKIFKKLIPSPKVRDALMFRKSGERDDEESEKEGFFKRLRRDSKGEGDEATSNSEGFFKRLMKDNKSEDEEITNSSEGFFKRLLSSKGENEELTSSSDGNGMFKRLLRDNKGDEEDLSANSESFFKRLLRENKKDDEESNANSEGFFKKLFHIFQEAGLPLWLRPYEVLVTSSYTALIETIPDTASIHSIKSRYPNITSLRDFFAAKYKENSPSFKFAQRNFVESMAGYSLVCYLLQVKDRHNGNLLLDEEGHIIHIDFGFMLSNSPGGVNFESAPFKLTRELLEVMDSDADGVPSEFFDYFKVLCIQGFLTCRKHAERIILLVEMLQDSGYPCFKGGPRTIQNLRKRFHLSLTEEQCVSLVLSLISSSLDAWRTRQYDYYQRVLNGIL